MIDYYDLEKLTLEELLGLALRDTTSVKELATKYNTARSLHHATLKGLESISGIGKKKGLQILAMLEISRRIIKSPPNNNPIITNPAEVVGVVKNHLKLLDPEHFIVFNRYYSGINNKSKKVLAKFSNNPELLARPVLFLNHVKYNDYSGT